MELYKRVGNILLRRGVSPRRKNEVFVNLPKGSTYLTLFEIRELAATLTNYADAIARSTGKGN